MFLLNFYTITMIKLFKYTAISNGYDSVQHMKESLFHPESFSWAAPLAGVLGTVSVIFEQIFGIHIVVFLVLCILFFLELYTGIKASKREGKGFRSSKFQKGWFKLGVYAVMIGSMNICAIYIPNKPIFGININIYGYLHYVFYNYVLIALFISNVENFVRLGWKMNGFIPLIAKRLNLEVVEKEKNKDSK